jgi:hypothetical protein
MSPASQKGSCRINKKQAGDAIAPSNVSPGLTRGRIPVRVRKRGESKS